VAEHLRRARAATQLQTVFDTIVANSARLSGTEAGAIYVLDERQKEFQLPRPTV
jgi:hypothetical protein